LKTTLPSVLHSRRITSHYVRTRASPQREVCVTHGIVSSVESWKNRRMVNTSIEYVRRLGQIYFLKEM
jgi:hypothetical protein